jgi:C4-dicarboxylate-binding protein DctP
MIKRTLAMVLALMMSLSLVACGSSSGSSTADSDADSTSGDGEKQVINLTIGAGHSAGSMEYIDSLDNFFKPEVASRVAEETDYEIKWTDAYGTVAGLSETVTATQDGLVDFCVVTLSPVSGQLPYHQFSIYLPFCTGDNEICLKAAKQVYSEFPDELVTSLETSYNSKLLSIMVLDSYEIFSDKPMTTVADLDGAKIGGSGRNLLWLENTGAVAVQSNMGDGYTSLQTGLINGQFAAPHWAIKANYQDICKYATDMGIDSTAGEILIANMDKWNALPTEVQDIITEVSAELETYHLDYTNSCRQAAYDAFTAAGGTIVSMSAEEQAKWLATIPNIPDTATELGETGLKILQRYVEILKEDYGVTIPREWEFNY